MVAGVDNDLFTTTEVAVILAMAGTSPGGTISKRAVDSVVDKRLFPPAVVRRRQHARALTTAGLKMVAAEFTLRRELPVVSMRKLVYANLLQGQAGEGHIPAGGAVSVDLTPQLRQVTDALAHYRELMAQIEVSPKVQRGEPVLRGTRVTVHTIAEMVEQGTPTVDILRHYPTITAEQVEAAQTYARAHPRRGRPPLPDAGKIVARMSVDTLKAM